MTLDSRIDLTQADLEQAAKRWSRLAEDPLTEMRKAGDGSFDKKVFDSYQKVTDQRWPNRLLFVLYLDDGEIAITYNYKTAKKDTKVSCSWRLDRFPSSPLAILGAFYGDLLGHRYHSRRQKYLMKNKEWLVKELQNFISSFMVPERSDIHELTDYDS